MNIKLIATREGILKLNIKCELASKSPDIDKIMKYVLDFEKNNLATIEKLKRDKAIETKKISGALKNTINAHGPITKVLIGSATKRIWGSLLTTEPIKKKFVNKPIIIGFIIGLLTEFIINYFFL